MENTRRTPKSASIALLMAVLGVIFFVSELVFGLDSDLLDILLISICFFSFAGFIVGIYSLTFKRSNRGIAAVLISTLMIVIIATLVFLFRDMCVIC